MIGNEITIKRRLITPNEASRTSGSAYIAPCSTHKPVQMSYIDRYAWATKQLAAGHEQQQCPICQRWYFPNEF